MEDLLIWCRRRIGPVARRIGAQDLARWVYRELASRRYPRGTLCTAVQNGRTWRLRREVAEWGVSVEFGTIEWLREVIRPGMTVLDVGANVGQMSLEMAELVGSHGHVVAIEPSAGNLDCLRAHVDANGFHDRIEVVAAACADEHGGEVTFYVASNDGDTAALGTGHNIVGATAILKQKRDLQVREVRVPRISIDELCRGLASPPSVIKIDVEGAELLVLRGAIETLRVARPKLRVAFHPFAFDDPAAASAELFQLADQAGYLIGGANRGATLELAEYNLIPS